MEEKVEKKVERIITIKNNPGLHLRAACNLAKFAKQFKAGIWLSRLDDTVKATAKSILSIITLGAIYNQKLLLTAKGEDAKEAIEKLVHFIEVEKLNEE